jgi:hypothetical protein
MQPDSGRQPAEDGSMQKLQECLQAEVSAVATYQRALESIAHVGLHRALQEILVSHARRAELVRGWIAQIGGRTVTGGWGVFANLIETGPDLLGQRLALAALEEGERRGLDLYTEVDGCDAETAEWIRTRLLPEQRRTCAACRTLTDYAFVPS